MNNIKQTIRYISLSLLSIFPMNSQQKSFLTLLSSNSENQHQPNSHIETNQLNLISANQLQKLTRINDFTSKRKTQPSILLVELGDRGKSSSQSA